MQIRHGDLLLIRKSDVVQKVPTGKKAILARGEATGHTHTLVAGKTGFIDFSDDVVTVAGESAALKHQEHKTLEIPVGIWELRQQAEWVNANKEYRYVRD